MPLGSTSAPTLGPGQFVTAKFEIFDHYFDATYCPNAALSNESDPAARFSEVADRGLWLVTRDAAPTIVVKDSEPKGVLSITPGTSANDFVSAQMNGQSFQCTTGRRIYFEARIKTNDADDIKFFIGLASTDTTGTTAGPVLDGTTASIGFRNVLGNTTTFLAMSESASTESTGTAGTLADDTFTVLAFEVIERSRINFYVNGALVYTATSNIPLTTEYLTPTMEVGSPTGTTATTLEVDYTYFAIED